MTEFLAENSLLSLSLVSFVTFGLIYIWIKTYKIRYVAFSFSILFICFSFLTPYAYSDVEFHNKVISKEEKNNDVINELTVIMNNKENEKYPVFREMINIMLKNGNYNMSDYQMIKTQNKSEIFKESLQIDRQQLEDVKVQMQLMYMQPEE